MKQNYFLSFTNNLWYTHLQVHANIKRTFNRYVMRQRSTMSLRSSTSQFFSRRQSSIPTQNTQYPNSDIDDSIQLHSIHTNKLCSYKGKVCNKPSNNGANVDRDGCTGFTSSIIALTHTSKCSLSDQPMEKQITPIPFEISTDNCTVCGNTTDTNNITTVGNCSKHKVPQQLNYSCWENSKRKKKQKKTLISSALIVIK